MKCWRCNSLIDKNALTCGSCGANLLRGEPSTQEGKALRQLFDTVGADHLLSNPTIIINGLDDLLPFDEEFVQTVKCALNADIGILYLDRIKTSGTGGSSFNDEIISKLRIAGMTLEESKQIVNSFDEMIGWNALGASDASFALAIQFQQDSLLWGISSSPSSVFSAPLSSPTDSISDGFSDPEYIKSLFSNKLVPFVSKAAEGVISLPSVTMKERAAIDKAMTEFGIFAPTINSDVVSVAYHIDRVINKPQSGSIVVLCIMFSGTSYEIGIIDFSIDGVIEIIGRASHKTTHLNSILSFDALRNDICSLIDETKTKSFSRIFISSNIPNNISKDLSVFFHTAVDLLDDRAVMKGLLRCGEIKLGKEENCLLLDVIDYSVSVNNQHIMQANTTFPTSKTTTISCVKSAESQYLELQIKYFLDYNGMETIKLPIADIIDNRNGRIDLSVTFSIDNRSRINLYVTNTQNNKEMVFDWEYIKNRSIPKQTSPSPVPENDIAGLIRKASNGDPDAQNLLGYRYQKGQGIEQNYAEALKWYRKAAEQGHAVALNNLGYCYQHGLGVEQNYAEAMKWYHQAAQQGNSIAQNNLGYCYQYGIGVEKSYAEAFKLYQQAAEQGNDAAENSLGVFYENGYGVGRDYDQAFFWYNKSAYHGNMYGQYDLADCYDKGKGTEQNPVEAVRWYKAAAEQGHSEAQNALGYRYYHGKGIEQNYAEAVKWYREAAAHGNSAAANNLGICYENGYGIEKDLSQALAWYSKSAIQGNMYGQYDLATCYEFGKGVQQSIEEARQWYQKAADQGLAAAQEILKKL